MVAVTFLRRFQPSFKLLCIIAFLRRLRDSRPEHGVPSTERALEELLGSSTDYAGAVCHVKPFERGKVSFPSSQRRPVVLTDVCDPVCRRLLETFEDQQVQLFDLANDLGETQDVSQNYPEITQRLADQLKAWRADVNAPVPTLQNPGFKSQ